MTPQFYDTPTLSLIFTLLLHLPLAISYITPSTGPIGTWLYPSITDIPTFNYLDTLDASWQTNFPNAYLALYCGASDNTNVSLCNLPLLPPHPPQLTNSPPTLRFQHLRPRFRHPARPPQLPWRHPLPHQTPLAEPRPRTQYVLIRHKQRQLERQARSQAAADDVEPEPRGTGGYEFGDAD